MSAGDRRLGAAGAAMLVAGNMVGSGLFLLPATLASVGSLTVLTWIVAALGALALALVYAGLARLRPEWNGVVEAPARALGPFAGFQAWFAYWLSCWAGNAAIALAAAGYLAVFAPAPAQTWAVSATAAGLIWLLTLANLAGARWIGRLAGLTLVVGLLPVAAAVGLGVARFDPALFTEAWNPRGEPLTAAVPGALVLVFWAFLGLESASASAAVVRDPERNIPRAALGGVALAALVYLAATTALFGLVPAASLAASTAPFAEAAALWLGAGAALVVAGCAAVKTVGTLAGWILVVAETGRAGARAGFLPRLLSEPGGPERRPKRDLLVGAVLTSAAVVVSTAPTLGEQFGLLIEASTVLFLVVYALGAGALIREAGLRRPGLLAAAVLSIGFCVWAVAASGARAGLIALGVLGLGAILFLFRRKA